MKRTLHLSCALFISFAMTASLSGMAQERDRAKIAETYKWNLTPIYPDVAAWQAAKDKTAARIPDMGAFRGRLLSSGATLADGLDRMFSIGKDLSRLSTYAALLSDQDSRDGTNRGMRLSVSQIGSGFSQDAAFVVPEILKGGREAIERLIDSEPRLRPYTPYLQRILRREAHILTENEERILAAAGQLSGAPSQVQNILANADFPHATVTLSTGRAVKLDQAAFNDLRTLPNRADREKVMSTFFQSLGSFSRTYGATLNGQAQKSLFYMKARKYPSTLEMSLDGPNIPVAVYSRLIEGVNQNLDTFHRYLNLRRRMLGLDQLHYYDLYTPLVASENLKYTPEEAEKIVRTALAPLGSDYAAGLDRAFKERWIDWLPADGKVAGAYSSGGAVDVHPYVLMNFNGNYTDVGALAHELGHAMHSYFSNTTQPYALAGYPTFTAEVASTFNESILIEYMLKNVTDPETRLSLLGRYLENAKGSLFRQTQFAEFELRFHEMAQKGEPIVGDALAKLYMDITKKYYGHDKSVCIVDDYVMHEWSMIPHFYNDFYVYQYATSFTAAEGLAAKVKSGDDEALQRYLRFLRSGGSKEPIDLLKDAGVDMTTNEPLNLTIQTMNRVMDEMERILANRQRQ